jgi:fumarate reductase (CoM/CoB) subunit A
MMSTKTTEVLIIGAGAAGIRAALAASAGGTDVLLISEGPMMKSGSTFSSIAQGWGIQALVQKERTPENLEIFYHDIMRVGLGQCDLELAQLLVEESGPRLEDLLAFGIRFKKDTRGNFIRARGCFSEHERAFLTESMINVEASFLSILRRSSVKIIQGFALDLLISEAACWGAWILEPDGDLTMVHAKATVLATGGGAGIFRDHLVTDRQVGNGYSLAHRAGAELANLEFIQFMLGLKGGETRCFLPLGDLPNPGVLLDREHRDVLDAHLPESNTKAKAVQERQRHAPFSCRDDSGRIDIAIARLRQAGEPIRWGGSSPMADRQSPQVLHCAHAFNGGIRINRGAESTIGGLFAAGEVAAGPHGADRIGGCMMTATQVFGHRAGKAAAMHAKALQNSSFPDTEASEAIQWANHAPACMPDLPAADLRVEITEAMGQHALVLRSEKGLAMCLEILGECQCELEKRRVAQRISPIHYFELRDMIQTAGLVTTSALSRKESLGPHFREDSPGSKHPL